MKKLLFYIIVLFIFNSPNLSCQTLTELIDSLEYKLAHTESDSVRFTTLNSLSYAYMDVDVYRAIELGKQGLELARKLKSRYVEGDLLIRLGTCYFYQEEYETAINYYQNALDIFESLNDKQGLASVYWGMGVVEYNQENLDKTLLYYEKALETFQDIEDQKSEADLLINIGIIKTSSLNQFNEGIKNYNEALNIYQKNGYKAGIANAYYNIGNAYANNGSETEAIKYLQRSIDVAEEEGYEKIILDASMNFSEIFFSEKNWPMAKKYLQKSIPISKKMKRVQTLSYAYGLMADIYFQEKNFKEAYEYLNESKFLDDSLNNAEREKQYREILTRFETERVNKENLLLNLKNDQQKTNLRFLTIITVSLSFLIIVIVVLLVFIRKKNHTLRKNQEQIKAQHKQIIESEKLYRTLIETSPDGTAILNRTGEIVFASDYLCKILGEEKMDHCLGENFLDFIDDTDYPRAKEDLDRIFTGEKFNVTEYRLNQSNNSEVYISINFNLIKNEAGIPDKILYIVRDITHFKKAQLALQHSEKHLKELLYTKDRFFSILAHDLKNPFNSILGFSQILVKDYDSLGEQSRKEFILQIYNSSNQLYRLLQNLLTWSQSQLGLLHYQPQKVNISKIIKEIEQLVIPQASLKKIQIINKTYSEVWVFADKNMVSTAIRNLLTNGIKYTHPNGWVEVETIEESGEVGIFIRDNGIGIKEEDMDKLFRTDVKFQKMGTNNEDGTGLGLLICKEFIEKNKGSIHIKSIPSKGTEFKITLPAKRKQTSN